ncbi:hypothetical protein AWB75_07133 [Caballeronia catudaia]|uniref:Uncharacterized protein n=1 Tax=Caballeronia catudaia TaxID=1777136 RepID=A0A158DSJ7_9BURK|nr:hypothetical protein AWB75_07133 [Caballeronia catudaia]
MGLQRVSKAQQLIALEAHGSSWNDELRRVFEAQCLEFHTARSPQRSLESAIDPYAANVLDHWTDIARYYVRREPLQRDKHPRELRLERVPDAVSGPPVPCEDFSQTASRVSASASASANPISEEIPLAWHRVWADLDRTNALLAYMAALDAQLDASDATTNDGNCERRRRTAGRVDAGQSVPETQRNRSRMPRSAFEQDQKGKIKFRSRFSYRHISRQSYALSFRNHFSLGPFASL